MQQFSGYYACCSASANIYKRGATTEALCVCCFSRCGFHFVRSSQLPYIPLATPCIYSFGRALTHTHTLKLHSIWHNRNHKAYQSIVPVKQYINMNNEYLPASQRSIRNYFLIRENIVKYNLMLWIIEKCWEGPGNGGRGAVLRRDERCSIERLYISEICRREPIYFLFYIMDAYVIWLIEPNWTNGFEWFFSFCIRKTVIQLFIVVMTELYFDQWMIFFFVCSKATVSNEYQFGFLIP